MHSITLTRAVFAAFAIFVDSSICFGSEPRTETLDGRWEPVSGQEGGNPLTMSELSNRDGGFPITFHDSTLRIFNSINYTFENPYTSKNPKWHKFDLSDWPFAITLAASKGPNEMDIHGGAKASTPLFAKCIYSIEGDKLTICWGTETVRPDTFKTGK